MANIFLLWHVGHNTEDYPEKVHQIGGEVVFDEQEGDVVHLLGCYSTKELGQKRIVSARLLPGFREEPDCFILGEYVIDEDQWTDGFIRVD